MIYGPTHPDPAVRDLYAALAPALGRPEDFIRIVVPPGADTTQWFVACCRMCWPESTPAKLVGEQPFKSAESRDAWCTAHTQGTGHDKWIMIDG